MFKEFKEFAMKGNMLDLAVGVVIGGAFGKIVDSLVKDLIMPPIGLAGGLSFEQYKLVLKPGDGDKVPDVTLNWGNFVTISVQFLIVAFALFLVVKGINSMRRKAEEAPAAAPAPTKTEMLLEEIRDALKSKA